MVGSDIIKSVSEEKADELYDAVVVCAYCKSPFKDCDAIIPGIGFVAGEMDVVEYKNRFWHYGCIFDYRKGSILRKFLYRLLLWKDYLFRGPYGGNV